ncbi:MAG: hypothetical protein WBI07_03295, partial [Mobilitalea sp.]
MKMNNENSKDDMDIKARLNHSLDLSGITVSEDLIRRTLIKIKEQPIMLDNEAQQEELGMQKRIAKKNQNNQLTKEEMPSEPKSFREKIIPFSRYVRSLAGVAAAVAIFVVGIHAMQNLGSKSSTETMSNGVDNSTVMTSEMQRSTDEIVTEEAAGTERATSGDAAATDGNAADSSGSVDSALIEDSKSLKFGLNEDTAADAEEDTDTAESTE